MLSSDSDALRAMARDLGKVRVLKEIAPALDANRRLMVKTLRDDVRESPSFKGMAGSITSETRATSFAYSSEIGAVTSPAAESDEDTPAGTAGDLGHFAYIGGTRHTGHMIRDVGDALKSQIPQMTANVEAALAAWEVLDGRR